MTIVQWLIFITLNMVAFNKERYSLDLE